MARLLIVSNRLPVTVRAERDKVSVIPSAGGLATPTPRLVRVPAETVKPVRPCRAS